LTEVTFDTIRREFIDWHVLTCVGIYREDANGRFRDLERRPGL